MKYHLEETYEGHKKTGEPPVFFNLSFFLFAVILV